MKLFYKHILEAIKYKALKSKNGYYYYIVPTSVRRNAEMKVPIKTIEAMIKKGIISRNEIPPLNQN